MPTDTPPKRAAIYCRVSTAEQERGYSLPTQLEAARALAAEQGYTIAAEFAEDYTGTVMDRPQLNRLMAMVEAGEVDTVICYEVDRLARKVVYQLLIEEELMRRGVPVEYVLGRYDETPEGQLMKQIRATVAEYERAKILERTTRGKRGRAQAGQVHVALHAPYGYRYLSEPHRGWLEVEPEEAAVVRQVFAWYTVGDETGKRLSTRGIARRLTQLRIPTKADLDGRGKKDVRGRGVWAGSSVTDMLNNETYAGTWYYNRTRRTGKTRTVRKDPGEWIAVAVPAIISRETWAEARRLAEENTEQAKRNVHYDYLLRGRLTCDRCGKRFRGFAHGPASSPGPFYYRCLGVDGLYSADSQTATCHWSLRADKADTLVWEAVKGLLQDPLALLEGAQESRAAESGARAALSERLAALDQMLAALERQQVKLLDAYMTADDFPKPLFEQRTSDIARRRESFEAERAKVLAQLADGERGAADVTALQEACRRAAVGIEHFNFEERARVMDLLRASGLVIRVAKGQDRIILTVELGALVPVGEDGGIAPGIRRCSGHNAPELAVSLNVGPV